MQNNKQKRFTYFPIAPVIFFKKSIKAYSVILLLILPMMLAYGCGSSTSLTENEKILCKILHLESQYKKNPKYTKCVLSHLSKKFSDELDVIDSYKKGDKTGAVIGGMAAFMGDGLKNKIASSMKEIYEECKKYK